MKTLSADLPAGSLRVWRSTTAVAILLMAMAGVTVAGPASAQVSGLPPDVLAEEAPYQLVFDHVTATFRLLRPDGRQLVGWDASGQRALAPVPPTRPLEVVIVNANTLLYSYEISSEPIQGGRQVRACRDVGREAISTGFFVGSRSFTGGETGLPSLAGTLEDVRAAQEEVEEASFAFAGGAPSAQQLMSQARSQASRYQILLTTTADVAASMEESVAEIAAMADVRPITELVDSLVASLEAVQPGLGNPRLVPALLSSHRNLAQSTMNSALAMGGPGIDVAAQSLRSELTAAAQRERVVAGELQDQLLILAHAAAAARQSVTTLPAGVHRQITIQIQDNQQDVGVRRTRTGRVIAYTRPAVAMLCEVSFGLAWMGPPAQYRVNSSSRLINDSRGDDVRTTANLMLHLSASAIPILGLAGGLGLGSATAPDLYLGGTIRLFRPLMLNGGLVWQRQALLPEGLSVGDTLDDPSRLDDLEQGYRPTAFFGVSFAR